jgi:hypothetical protein
MMPASSNSIAASAIAAAVLALAVGIFAGLRHILAGTSLADFELMGAAVGTILAMTAFEAARERLRGKSGT